MKYRNLMIYESISFWIMLNLLFLVYILSNYYYFSLPITGLKQRFYFILPQNSATKYLAHLNGIIVPANLIYRNHCLIFLVTNKVACVEVRNEEKTKHPIKIAETN